MSGMPQTPSSEMAPEITPARRHLALMTLLEGGSLIALVLIAVPLKHLGDWPLGVSVIGPIHGALFLWTMAVLILVLARKQLSLGAGAVVAVAALIPFGGLASHRIVRRPAEKREDA
ncbi:MAG: DUF3817 domain-containing protein [Halothiobacillaceae bacterium]